MRFSVRHFVVQTNITLKVSLYLSYTYSSEYIGISQSVYFVGCSLFGVDLIFWDCILLFKTNSV